MAPTMMSRNPDFDASQSDGSPPRVLLSSARRYPGGIALRRLRFDGGLHVASRLRHARVLFSLTKASVPYDWRLAGEPVGHEAKPGSLYVMPASADCVVDTREGVDVRCLSIPNEVWGLAVGESGLSRSQLGSVVAGEDPILLATSHAMEREAGEGFPNGVLFWTSLADRVIERLIQNYLPASPEPVGGTLSGRALARINDLIAASMDEPISLDDLARAAAQSRFHFQRTFRRSLGLTPHRYVMLLRLKRAVSLVRAGNLSLAAVAVATGFVDQSHLARWVKGVYGLTPSGLRGR